jgi:hypothetical protein
MNLADAQSRINALFGYEPSEAELLARPDLIDIAIEAVRASVFNVSQVVTALNTFFDAEYTADDLKQRVDLLKIGMAILAADNTGDGGGASKYKQTQYAQFDSAIFEPYTIDTQTPIPDFELSITPSSASSKILVTINAHAGLVDTNNGTGTIYYLLGLKRNGTAINNSTGKLGFFSALAMDTNEECPYSFAQYLDSPNTTATVTYAVTVANREPPQPSADLYIYAHDYIAPRKSSILLQEIVYP